jgi:type III secretion protein V
MVSSATVRSGFVMLAARSDLAVAILLVAVLFMIILPLPTQLVDALIAFNLCSAAVLLMVAVYIPTPVKFAAFPSVLLLSTLFRLALAISTTRLILLQADAGQIIQTFGEFVVGGNLVVGLVVFLIITVVQFVVITKGAERVAEVAARFSLDAMPGKQMSIDSDMRSGLIDMVQARERRRMLERESQLYGSMDGAMKFVKGDAIAGLLIIFINIIGGIAIGTLQRGLDLDQALEIYSILTIGDGLVQQIPGLFVSVTAGIVVTRVADDDSSNLGGDIASQIGAQPKALMVAGGILGGFAMVPGFPTLTFIALGVLVGGGGYLAYRRATRPAPTRGKGALPAVRASTEAEASGEGNGESEFSITVPLMVDVATDVEDAISPDLLNEELARVRRALYYDLGVPFPGIHLRFNAQLPPSSYQILVEEVPVSQGQLRAGSLFVRETAEHLDMLGVPYEQADPFLPRLATIWVSSEHREQLTATGIAFMEGSSVLTYHLSFVLRKYAAEFLGIQETRFLLAQMEGSFGELVKEVQRLLPLQKIAEILQRLVSESISIRNLRAVLEALLEWGQKEKDAVLLTEYVRSHLKRYVSYKYCGGHNILASYLLTPDVEDTIRNAIRQTSSGSYLALDPAIARRFTADVKEVVGDVSGRTPAPVLLVSMDIRRYTRKLIEGEMYDLPVLSYQELTPEITIQPLGRIEL